MTFTPTHLLNPDHIMMKQDANGSSSKPYARLESITPELAQNYLDKNYKGNRNLGEGRTDAIADQIRRNLWVLNGATICFNEAGDLTDGQHRLKGIIKSKKAVESFVVRNLPPKAFHTIDTGRIRSTADIFRISGELDVNVLSCASRFIMSYEKTGGFGHKSRERVAFADLAAVLKRNPGLRDAVRASHEYSAQIKKIGPSFVAAFYYTASLVSAEETKAFFDHLFIGTDLSKGHPVLALRKLLLEQSTETFRRTEPNKMFRLWLKTWNLWAKGEQVSTITVRADDALDRFEPPVKNWRLRYGITYPKDASTARTRDEDSLRREKTTERERMAATGR